MIEIIQSLYLRADSKDTLVETIQYLYNIRINSKDTLIETMHLKACGVDSKDT